MEYKNSRNGGFIKTKCKQQQVGYNSAPILVDQTQCKSELFHWLIATRWGAPSYELIKPTIVTVVIAKKQANDWSYIHQLSLFWRPHHVGLSNSWGMRVSLAKGERIQGRIEAPCE